jgi:hypothetical protein
MGKRIRFALAVLLLPLAAQADLLVIPEGAAPTTPVDKPDKGMSMSQVMARYGEPVQKHGTVGGASKWQPPITRWDYAAFTVVFENDHVIDAVVPEQPPPIYDQQELQGGPAPAPPTTP